jgi:hypothetical protein
MRSVGGHHLYVPLGQAARSVPVGKSESFQRVVQEA